MGILTSSVTFAAAIGSGLIGGFFFAFSNLVMPSLGRLPSPAGMAAMQTINVVVLNPFFFLAFFGTAALCLVLIAIALLNLGSTGMPMLLIAGLVYLAGVILVTMAFNVPLNNALARADAASAAGATLWADYLSRWTMWNHVRTAAGLIASGAFALALRMAG